MITKFKIYENLMDTNMSTIGVKVLHILSQIQMFHWQTDKYSQHEIFDDFSEIFKELSDKLIEVIQGKYGRIEIDDTYTPIRNLKDLDPYIFIENCILYFETFKKEYFNQDDDIIGVFDEILAEFQKMKYLLSFRF